jgi:cell shape-determining protein MreD
MLFYTLPLLAVLVVVRLGRGSMFPGNVVMPWLVAALATVAFALLQRALLPLLGGAVRFGPEALGREILPEVALNLLWLPLAFFPLRALARHYGVERIEWER